MGKRLCWAALLISFVLTASAQDKPQGKPKQSSASAKSRQTTAEPRGEQERDNPRAREQWLYRQRAYPFKRIPPGARAKAMRQMDEMRRAERQRGFIQAPATAEAISANTMTWTPIGPQPSDSGSVFGLNSGRVSAIAVDPMNQNVVYLGGAQGGVWKTTDGGQNWTPLTDDQPSLAVGSIALDNCNASDCLTIYVGTGEEVFSGDAYYGAGVLKSTDGGLTWTQFGQSIFGGPLNPNVGGARIGSLVISPGNNQLLLAGVQKLLNVDTGTSSGIYRSLDGGVTWAQILSGAPSTEVLFDPAATNCATGQPCVAYAGLGNPQGDTENGVYRIQNAGSATPTITKLAGGLPTANVGRIELAIAPSNSMTLFASIANSSTFDLLGLFKSTDGGTSWTQLTATPNFCEGQCDYDNVIRVHPTNPSIVYAGGSAAGLNAGNPFYLIRSTDGGNTWSSIVGSSPVPHVDQHAMAFGFSGASVTRLYIGNDGGVWRTDNPAGAITWTNLNNTLGLTQHYPGMAIHPSNENFALSGSQDNDTSRYSGALLWQQIGNVCDGGWSVIDPAVPSTWYATCEYLRNSGIDFIFKSVQNGSVGTFAISENGINTSDSGEFIPPLVGDPNISDRLYFGTFRVYQTTNGGASWQAISPDVSGGSVLETIAVAPSDSNVVYVGSATGVVESTANAGGGTGAIWTNVTGTGLPGRFITQIAVHPTLPNTVYVAFSGFGSCSGCDGKGHLFRSVVGGITWTDISGNLPDTPVNDVAVDPNDATGNTLYIGTDVGVFFTVNGGINWNTLMSGLPNVAVFSLKLHPASRILRAGTHGRSVWDLQLQDPRTYYLRSISPTTAAAGTSTNVNLVAVGAGFTASSVVEFNGTPLTTTQDVTNPTTQLNATIPAALLATAGVPKIRVNDPGAGITNELAFTVTGPAPTLTSVSPNLVMNGSGNATDTLTGTSFASATLGRFLQFNATTQVTKRTDLSSTPGSSTQFQATIPASLLATGGIFSIVAFTPPPGGGESNEVTFTVTAPAPPNDNFANAIVISGSSLTDMENNVGATTEASDPNPGSFTSCPQAGRNYSIWYRFTPTSNVTVTADTIGSVYDTVLSVWSGTALGSLTPVACNDDFAGFRAPSSLTVNLTAGVTYNFMITGFGNTDAGQTVFHFSVAMRPPNDNFAAATAVSSGIFTDSVNSLQATTEATDPTLPSSCFPAGMGGLVNGGRAKSIWYRFTPTSNATVTADTFGSNYDTLLSVWTGSAGSLTNVACNDDSGAGVQSAVSFSATANTTYFFMVSAFVGDGGSTLFNFSSTASPAADFSMTPASTTVTVNRGSSASTTISVAAISGFSGTVTFSCSGLPRLANCSFNPASAAPGNSTMLTISAAATGSLPPPGASPRTPQWQWRGPWWMLALGTWLLLLWRMKSRRIRLAGTLGLLLLLTALQTSCGGGGNGGGGGGGGTGTPAGTYSITVNGTSGATTRTTSITLVVN